jgi:hypothetical protein
MGLGHLEPAGLLANLARLAPKSLLSLAQCFVSRQLPSGGGRNPADHELIDAEPAIPCLRFAYGDACGHLSEADTTRAGRLPTAAKEYPLFWPAGLVPVLSRTTSRPDDRQPCRSVREFIRRFFPRRQACLSQGCSTVPSRPEQENSEGRNDAMQP